MKWAFKFMRLWTTVNKVPQQKTNYTGQGPPSELNSRLDVYQSHFVLNPKAHHRVPKDPLTVPKLGRMNPVHVFKSYYLISILLLFSISVLESQGVFSIHVIRLKLCISSSFFTHVAYGRHNTLLSLSSVPSATRLFYALNLHHQYYLSRNLKMLQILFEFQWQ
jgi:hypothetical protein